MTIEQVAAILLRISSVGWFVEVLVAMTGLPGDILGVVVLQPGYLANQRELALVMVLLRICLYLGIGIAFLFFSRPLAKLAAKGL
jgi:hypothetical protein